jgi:hypothetical protein
MVLRECHSGTRSNPKADGRTDEEIFGSRFIRDYERFLDCELSFRSTLSTWRNHRHLRLLPVVVGTTTTIGNGWWMCVRVGFPVP